MRKHSFPALAGLTLLAVVLVGCGGSSTSPPSSTDLSGNYNLTSLKQSGFTFAPPIATGTLVLTRTNYTLHLIVAVPSQPADTVQDAGTYTTSGSQWTQTSSQPGGTQSVGTFTLQNNVLTVNVTTQGQAVTTVWQKQ